MLQLASLPAVRRGGRPAPDVREPIELQAGILAERRKAPAPAEEPSKATDRSSLVSTPHVAPPRPGTLLRGQLKQVMDIPRSFAPSAENEATNGAI